LKRRFKEQDMRRRTLIAGAALIGAAPLVVRAAVAQSASIAERFAQTLSAHDIDAFAALYAEDYVNHQVSAAAPPPPPGVKPKEAVVAFFAARLKGLPDLKVSVQTSLADADKVAASFAYEGTHQGLYYGVLHLVRYPPPGRRADRRALGDGRHRWDHRAAEGVGEFGGKRRRAGASLA
jgi:ketosteroid isomerase-like protein